MLLFTGCRYIIPVLYQSCLCYKKLKNVRCKYDRVNGWNSTLQAAWSIRHVRITWFVNPPTCHQFLEQNTRDWFGRTDGSFCPSLSSKTSATGLAESNRTETNALYVPRRKKTTLISGAGEAGAARARDSGGRSHPHGGPTGSPRARICGSFCAEGDEQPAAIGGAADAKVWINILFLWVRYVTHVDQLHNGKPHRQVEQPLRCSMVELKLTHDTDVEVWRAYPCWDLITSWL